MLLCSAIEISPKRCAGKTLVVRTSAWLQCGHGVDTPPNAALWQPSVTSCTGKSDVRSACPALWWCVLAALAYKPQWQKVVRQCEDAVKVRTGQQLVQLRLQPLLACALGAAWATAVAAGVVLGLTVVPCGARQHVATQCSAVAVHDRAGSAPFPHRHTVCLCKRGYMFPKNSLQ